MQQIDITVKLKKTNDEKRSNHLDYNINNLRNNPSEMHIKEGIEKEDITNKIRREEKRK